MIRSRRVFTAVSSLLVALLSAARAHAAWTNQSAVNLPICFVVGSVDRPLIATDDAGGAIIVFADLRSGAYDIYAQRALAGGTVDPAWPLNGRIVCNAAGSQTSPVIVADGTGGAIIAWQDARGTSTDIYAHHVLANGVMDPAWPVNGRLLCGATSAQSSPVITTDGAGGAIVAWTDFRNGSHYDIYALRVLASGIVDPAWPVDGRAVCTAAGDQTSPTLTTDGAGGALIAWIDNRVGGIDLYADRVLAGGAVDPAWPANGRALCVANGSQSTPQIVPDGLGGGFVVWADYRGASAPDVYATRVLPNGTSDPYWGTDGTAVSAATNTQYLPKAVADGAGGLYVAWSDYRNGVSDLYAAHLGASGSLEAGWVANGNAICAAGGDQLYAALVSDGAGGAIVAWDDTRSNTRDLYATHLLATGLDPIWPSGGRALSTASNNQYQPALVADGAGGAIATFLDFRNNDFDGDVYAQRVARFGYLGSPEPAITAVDDVPNDQGGRVKVSWNASYLDPIADANLAAYDVLRSVPTSAAMLRLARGARAVSAPTGRDADQLFVTTVNQVAYYWEYMTSISPLHYVSGYSYLASTAADSTAAGNPQTAFMVVGRNTAGTMYWLSAPVTGYSVDDLAPAAPAPFAGDYGAGATHLHWGVNSETDLAGYRIYRGTSGGFVPGPGSFVAQVPDTGYADAGAAGSWYKLTAVDVHGNESPVATLSPGATVDVPIGASDRIAFAAPVPNPSRGSATFALSLPRAMPIRLAVFDAGGRRVRVLRDGAEAAGEHSIRWDLRDDEGGAVKPGLYFARLEADGTTLMRKMAAIPAR